jgi:hypothetical protein
MRFFSGLQLLFALAAVGLLGTGAADGQTVTKAKPVTLGWEASPDAGVAGYAVYYGPVSSGDLIRIATGLNLTCRLTNLNVGVTYRIFAVSHNALGLESPPSNEVYYTPTTPAVPQARLQVARLPDGNMRLNYPAPASGPYAIQFAPTPDARNWQTLTNVSLGAAGELVFTDATAAKVPQRFYRVAHSAQPVVVGTQVARQPNGAMKLAGLTAPEAYVQIQFTPVLGTAWTPLGNVFADAEGRFAFTDVTASTTGNRFYRMVILPPPPLTHMTITRLANGYMKLTGTAPAGAVCRVLHAPQLNSSNWPVLATVTANAEGKLEYVDATAPQAGSRFYRFFLP